MPKILKARPPHDDGEDRKVRKLAGARHAPADWTERARIITLSWDGLAVPAIAEQLVISFASTGIWPQFDDAVGPVSAYRLTCRIRYKQTYTVLVPPVSTEVLA